MRFPCEHSIRAHAYTFYPARDEFISTHTVFPVWVCVALECGRFRYAVEREDAANQGEHEIESGEAAFGDLIFAAPSRRFDRFALTSLTYHVLQWSFVDASGAVHEDAWRAGKWSVRDTGRLSATLGALKPLLGRADAWAIRRREHLLEELLHIAWQEENEPQVLEVSDVLMRDAARMMREKSGRALAMSEVSRSVGLGPVQFTRRFRAAFGQNPIEFLTQVRIESAQRMLIETGEPLDEIAFRCGWSSGAYLSSVFEKKLGTTPGRFRKAHRV